MPSIPFERLKEFADAQGLKLSVLYGFDGTHQHVVTYGFSTADADTAAYVGDRVKEAIGFPKETLGVLPPRVKALEDLLVQSLPALLADIEAYQMNLSHPRTEQKRHYDDVLATINALRSDRGEPPLEGYTFYDKARATPAPVSAGTGSPEAQAAGGSQEPEGQSRAEALQDQGDDPQGPAAVVAGEAGGEGTARDQGVLFEGQEISEVIRSYEEHLEVNSMRITTAKGVPMLVRIVHAGEPFGLELQLRNTKSINLVEFWDTRYDYQYMYPGPASKAKELGFPVLGQHIARYEVPTLAGKTEGHLVLDGSQRIWDVDEHNMAAVVAWLQAWR